MQTDRRTQRSYDDYTIVVVCALEFEMSAMRYMLKHEHSPLPIPSEDPNLYIFGELSNHNVILAFLPGNLGKGSAATVVADTCRSFPSISWILLVGIGGGVPSSKNDIRLGDVVVSMPDGEYGGVVQYDLGRKFEGGFKRTGFLSAPPARVRNAATLMRSSHRARPNKVDEIVTAMIEGRPSLSNYRRPSPELDICFHPNYLHVSPRSLPSCGACDKTRVIRRAARESDGCMIHYGLIASGDQVIRSTALKAALVQDIGEILCVEMEAAGIATSIPCMVIRGIADYADSHKNDYWQHYAAAAAAGCAKELLGNLPVENLPDA
ncbi:hypothetical protein GX50_03447 [[Emmonsia] crescens]|uniref:Nucleoside phosphorylase domain-containing protein n=1 Tax=[Emmonsia] crescens TaxID=73230 RepID=A0A2B7ZKK5_9EURO|nr:hypothetical protein GX50_03447 [Emmonsia crescens]